MLKQQDMTADRLSKLWSTRNTLNQTEWGELYQIIWNILISYHPPELKGLSLEQEDYIQQFFEEKVLRDTLTITEGLIHAGFIRYIYKRFLDSQFRSAKEKKNKITDSSDQENYIEKISEDERDKEGSTYNEEVLLNEYKINPAQLYISAKIFYKELEPWAKLYLSIHFCPDAQKSLPLNALAKRYQITSYHYKAGLLGITRKKNEDTQNYHKTMIGGWLSSTLNIGPSSENKNIIKYILQILCVTALNAIEEA
jgi:hypothetical protein